MYVNLFRSRWWSSVVVDDLFLGRREEKAILCVFVFKRRKRKFWEKWRKGSDPMERNMSTVLRSGSSECVYSLFSFSLHSQHSSHLFSVSLLIRSLKPTAVTWRKVMTTAVIAEMKSKYTSCAHYDQLRLIYSTLILTISQRRWWLWGSWRQQLEILPWNARSRCSQ